MCLLLLALLCCASTSAPEVNEQNYAAVLPALSQVPTTTFCMFPLSLFSGLQLQVLCLLHFFVIRNFLQDLGLNPLFLNVAADAPDDFRNAFDVRDHQVSPVFFFQLRAPFFCADVQQVVQSVLGWTARAPQHKVMPTFTDITFILPRSYAT